MGELRYLSESIKSEGNVVTGIAIVYDSPSRPMSFRSGTEFVEVIKQGAAKDAINGDTLALFEHKTENPLGRTGANLQLQETTRGIQYTLQLPDTSLGKDIRSLVSQGILKGTSFYIDVPKGGDNWTKVNGQITRTVNKLRSLPEISLVMSPAYPDTTAALRSFEEFTKEHEKELEDTGLLETLNKHRQLIIQRLND